jgi:hypothetical protein
MKRIRKFLKWATVTLCTLLFGALIFRGGLYRLLFSYKFVGHRTSYIAIDKELTGYIDGKTVSFKPTGIKDIIKMSLQLTSDRLNFKETRNDNDPNKLVRTRNAHCIGYSAFYSATCNYLLGKYGFADNWISQPLIAQIYFRNVNLHQYFTSSFFRDHDFNGITNKKTGEQYFVDPTVNDYFYIDFVTLKQ